jgi:hypothetical protein
MLFGWEGKEVCVKETKQQIYTRWGMQISPFTVSSTFHERCVLFCPSPVSLHFLVTLKLSDNAREFLTHQVNVVTNYKTITVHCPLLTFGTEVFHLIQINQQPNATIFQFIILTFVYSSTCFGSFPTIIRSSMTAVAASGFTFVSWW